jgi:MFS transporter, ACS family, pantothenate transporter
VHDCSPPKRAIDHALQVAWSILTFLLARASTPTHFYVLRFFIGLFEGGCHPGMQYVIASWYRKDELAKRSCIFQASGFVGYMVSGYLMAAVYHLSGVGGLKGWQWLFIIDGIISLPIALAGFWLLPDTPETTRAFYISKDEAAIAKRRMELEGRAGRAPWTFVKVRKILSSWHLWLLSLLYMLLVNAAGGLTQPAFQLWLKSQGYSVRDINVYPTLVALVSIVSTLAYAWVSDSVCKGARWPPMLFAGFASLVSYVSLAVWNVSPGWKWACYIIMGLGGGVGGLSHAWAAEITGADNEERAIVTAAMSQFSSIVSSWLPLLVWQVVEGPRYFKGFTTMAALWVAIVAVLFWLRFLHKRELAQRAASTV